jgi:hypothetical protein
MLIDIELSDLVSIKLRKIVYVQAILQIKNCEAAALRNQQGIASVICHVNPGLYID